MAQIPLCRLPIIMPLPAATVGATWGGITVDGMSSTGTEFYNSLSLVEMTFASGTTEALALSSATAAITILDAAAWSFRVDAITPWALAADHYHFSIQLTDTAGRAKVYFKGTIQSIANAVI